MVLTVITVAHKLISLIRVKIVSSNALERISISCVSLSVNWYTDHATGWLTFIFGAFSCCPCVLPVSYFCTDADKLRTTSNAWADAIVVGEKYVLMSICLSKLHARSAR